jgi:antitoxin StbD
MKFNIASITELRQPSKVLAKSGNEPTAILKRNEVVAYLVPVGAVTDISTSKLGKEKLFEYIKNELPMINHVLDYLRDK